MSSEHNYALLVRKEVEKEIENAREGTIMIALKHLYAALDSLKWCCHGRTEREIECAIGKLYGIYLTKEKIDDSNN